MMSAANEVPRIDALYPDSHSDLTDAELLTGYGRADHPWLRVNFISSIDGAATSGGLSAALGVPADHRVFNLLRRLTDVVLVGAGTVRAEGYGPMRLDDADVEWRLAAGLAAHPVFAIVSGHLDLDPASSIFTNAPVRPIVITSGAAPADARAAFEKVADVLVCGEDTLDVVFGELAAAGVVNELCLTVSPRLEAGDSRRIATGDMPDPQAMRLAHVLKSRSALLLRYVRED
jgi:riboflavin biosynthesis pyrimidine reductase